MTRPARHALTVPGRTGVERELRAVRSPYDGTVIAEVEQATHADIDATLEVQVARHRDHDAHLPAHRRIQILTTAAGLLRERREAMAEQIAREGGKPWRDALVEVDRAVTGLHLCAEQAGSLRGHEEPMGTTPASEGRLAFTTREPIGVVAAVSAFNHPLNLVVHQVGPALAAGCPVIVKPASATPLSCRSLVTILHEAGLPPEWCVALPMAGSVAEHLVTSEHIGFFSFIGSGEVGWRLYRRLAPGVRAALEHGGTAPVIVDEHVELDRCVPALVKGGYYHAGQVCVSVQRVFAHREVKDALVERLVDAVERLVTGDPRSPDTDVGPLIEQGEVERVHDWVTQADGAGAVVATGGRALGNQCYAPTLLVDTPDDARAMAEEIFGPVVNVVGYDHLDEAVARANAVPSAFQAAVMTRDLDRALYAARRLDATAVMVNDHTAFRVDAMPFGGRGRSGLGLGGIPATVEEMTRPKLLVLR